jgi:hypothetical protein
MSSAILARRPDEQKKHSILMERLDVNKGDEKSWPGED